MFYLLSYFLMCIMFIFQIFDKDCQKEKKQLDDNCKGYLDNMHTHANHFSEGNTKNTYLRNTRKLIVN